MTTGRVTEQRASAFSCQSCASSFWGKPTHRKRCIVRSRSGAALLALTAIALAPSLGVAQYAPKWHVGDWWVVKTWQFYTVSCKPEWDYTRYEIVGLEKVGNRDCFVLETRFQGRPDGAPARTKNMFSVRRDDWLVVRRVRTDMYNDTLLAPTTEDCPRGLFGPFQAGEPRLPRFPLQPGDPDTAFKLQRRDDGSALLREISRIADPALVKRMLDEGDTAKGRVVRPTGVVYQVREEMGGNLVPGPFSGEPRITQSLQIWCEGQPWRLYEEYVQYIGKKRFVTERSWLIASGHAGK